MRHWINLVERQSRGVRFEHGEIVLSRSETSHSDAFRIMHQGIVIGGCSIQLVTIEGQPKAFVHIHLDEKFRGKGFGRLAYEAIEKMVERSGRELLPSPMMTQDSARVWKKRSPEKMAHHFPHQDYWYRDYGDKTNDGWL